MHTYAFEIVPTGWTAEQPTAKLPFLPMVMDVPAREDSEDEHQKAARRAYFQAFHTLGQQGIDIEDYEVFEYDGNQRGRPVGTTGILG